MIIFDRDTKTLEIPAGLGNLEIVITSGASRYGVSSLNGQKGDLTLKTVNGNAILGSGDIVIEGGARIVNFDEMTQAQRADLFAELSEKWDSGETINDKYIFLKRYNDFGGIWVNLQFLFKDGQLFFGSTLPNPFQLNRIIQSQLVLIGNGTIPDANLTIKMIPEKTSDITNDSGFVNSAQTKEQIESYNYTTSAETQTAISSALTEYATSAQTAQAIATATQDMVTSTYANKIWVGTTAQYEAISVKDPNTLYFINDN